MPFASGSGTITDPYQIWTVEDLFETTASSNHYYYILMNDLDLSSYSPWTTLVNDTTNGLWIGSLDGNDKTINNLTLTTQSIVSIFNPFIGVYNYVGLFGDLTIETGVTESYVKNLHINNINITFENYDTDGALTYIGTLAARCSYQNILNVQITNLTESFTLSENLNSIEYAIGGLFADTYYANIYSCSVSASYFEVIGTASYFNLSTFNISMLSTINTYDSYSQCFIKDCIVKSDLVDEDGYVFEDAYITPFVTAYGYAKDMYIFNCLMTSSNHIVGFANTLINNNISNVYTSIDVGNTPSANIYPFIKNDYGFYSVNNCYYESGSYSFDNEVTTNGVTGLTAAQMIQSESYIGFDFVNIWSRNDSIQNGYPYLLFSYPSIPVSNYIVSGNVSSSLGEFMQNVTMSFTNGISSVYTDINGNYSQSVPENWSGSLSATASGYTFFIDYGVQLPLFLTASNSDRIIRNIIGVKDFSSGSGINDNPYIILDHEDVYNMRFRTGSNSQRVSYKLGSDIDLSPLGNWIPIGYKKRFYANINGDGYTISNLSMSSVPEEVATYLDAYYGFIGLLDSNTEIGNITFNSCSINISWNPIYGADELYFGIFAGYKSDGNAVKNVKIKNSTIRWYRNGGAHLGSAAIGGIFGRTNGSLYSCSVENSIVALDMHNISANLANGGYIGGLCGRGSSIYYSYVKDSTIRGQRSMNSPFDAYFGGLCGDHSTIYQYCYSLNNTVTSSVGIVNGFAYGINAASKQCYVARLNFGNTPVNKRYAVTNIVSGKTSPCYYASGSGEVFTEFTASYWTGSLSQSMQNSASYMGWDFENIWERKNGANYNYPYLKFEGYNPPEFIIISPNGGEFYGFGDLIPISWSFSQGTT